MDLQLTILLCEPDRTRGSLMSDYLRVSGYEVETAASMNEALSCFDRCRIDLCLSAIRLTDTSGIDFVHELRQRQVTVPIILYADDASKAEVLAAYAAGADDCEWQMLGMDVLVCKIKALFRLYRNEDEQAGGTYDLGNGLIFNAAMQRIGEVSLTTRESDILELFCENRNKLITRDTFCKAIWKSEEHFSNRLLSVYINRLRNYLKPSPSVAILSTHGRGYRLVDCRKED
ncbi:MAG: response regulator transcription factor [Paludibacteraceae bacterium]|nr:response regulator transcription factor [Paludibacteraceae bacterium]